MHLKTKRLSSGSNGIWGVTFRFETDEIKWLSTHLQGSRPKLTFHGTMADGLTLWFEPRGVGLWPAGENDMQLEGTVPAPHLTAFNGARDPVQAKGERLTYRGKPALALAPVPDYSRDAARSPAAAESLFNGLKLRPEPPAPPPETASIVAFQQPEPTRKFARSMPAMIATAQSAPAAPPEPTQITGLDAIANLKASIELVNEQIAFCGDDIVFAISEDRRAMRVIRRRVIVEELGG